MGVIRRFAVARLDAAARPGALRVGALDESGQEKKGTATAGVKRQHMGCAGGIDNGINTVHLAYVRADAGHALIGSRQWIPAEQISNPVTAIIMGLPPNLTFETKGELAIGLLADAYADGVRLDFVAGDEVYGASTKLRVFLEEQAQAYVLRVRSAFTLTLDVLESWVSGLDVLFGRVAARFGRVEPRRQARAYVTGLLAPVERKNSWQLAEAAGDVAPDRMQRLLNRARWDPHQVRADLREYVFAELGDPSGVLIVDETGFLKKGNRSAGVQRQFRRHLEQRGIGYVVAVPKSQSIGAGIGYGNGGSRADAVTADAPPAAWKRLSAGDGAKGPRLYDWALAALPPHPDDLLGGPDARQRWLLVRRSISDPDELAYYLCFGPAGTPLAELVRVAGARWAVEECFQSAKNEVGLDQYQVRRWDGWQRHITLAMLAHAYLAVTAAQAPKAQAAWSTSAPPKSDVSWHT